MAFRPLGKGWAHLPEVGYPEVEGSSAGYEPPDAGHGSKGSGQRPGGTGAGDLRGRVRPLGADAAVGWNFFPVAQRLGGAAVAGV